jgi:hypothetical protein
MAPVASPIRGRASSRSARAGVAEHPLPENLSYIGDTEPPVLADRPIILQIASDKLVVDAARVARNAAPPV